jgi:hypothetical protein
MKIDVAGQMRRAVEDTKNKLIQAEVAALNRAAKTALSRTIRFIREKYNLKLKDIMPYTTLVRANKNKRSVQIKISDQSIPLYKFGAKVKGRMKRKGVRGEVVVSEQIGTQKTIKGGFIATGKYGKGVFVRKTKARGPIKELFGPSAMQLFSSEQSQVELEQVFFERLEIEMDYAISHFVK